MSMQVGSLVQVLSVDDDRWQRGMARARAGAISLFASVGRGAATATGRIHLVAAKVAVIASAAALATTSVMQLVGALAAMSGLLLAVPALIVGVVAATQTLKLGLQGVGDAIAGDAEALAKLTPAARAFVREVRALQPGWDAVRRVVQEKLFAGLAGDVRALAAVWLPMLRQRLGEIAAGWNGLAREAATAGRDPHVVAGVTAALIAVASILDRARSAVGNLVIGLGELVGVGAPYIERLGFAVVDLIANFGLWLRQAAESGRLNEILDRAVTIARQFGDLLLQVGGIIDAVFSAAPEGGGFLTVLTEALRSVNTLLSGADGQAALGGLFASLGQIGGILATVIAQLGPGLSALLGALVVGLQALAPAAEPVGLALSAVAVAAAPLLTVLGNELALVLTIVANLLRLLAPVIQPVTTMLAELAAGVFPMLVDVVNQFATMALPMVIEVAQALSQALMPLVPVIVAIASELLSGLLPPLMELFTTTSSHVLPAIVQLVGVLGTALLQAFEDVKPELPELTRAGVALADAVIELFLALAPLIPVFVQIASKIITMAGESGILGFVIFMLSGQIAFVSGLVQFAAAMIGLLIAALRGAWHGMNALTGAVRSALAPALNLLRGLVDQVRGVFAGAGSWLVDAGRNIINGLINGVKSALGALRNTLSSVTNMIPDWKGPADRDRRLLRPSGRMLMQGLMAGIGAELPALRMQLGGVSNQIGAGVTPQPAAAPAAGPTVVQVLIGDKVVEDATLRVVTGNPERVALANRAGEKRLAYAG